MVKSLVHTPEFYQGILNLQYFLIIRGYHKFNLIMVILFGLFKKANNKSIRNPFCEIFINLIENENIRILNLIILI